MSKARILGMESELQPRPEPNEDRVRASLGRRVTAGLANAVLMWPACAIGAFFVILVEPLLSVMTTFEQCAFLCPVVLIPIMLVLTAWWKGVGRQNLGQKLVGISCVDIDSRQPSSWFQATAHAVLAIPLGPVMIVLLIREIVSRRSGQPSMWHDRMLGVAVVDHFAWKELLIRYCLKCGYDLRGSLQSERCPECGWPIDTGTITDESEIEDASNAP